MEDDRDPPIEPLDYLSGVKVVDIGDVRVSRGMTRRHHSSCQHKNVIYDKQERRIWCPDCEMNVEPFDAFMMLVEHFNDAQHKIHRREQELAEAEEFQLRRIASKVIDKAWRSKKMVPACPHCNNGLFPEDFKRRPTMLGRDYAKARIDRLRVNGK